ncbi:tRNA-guanine transglycosylase [Peniophora sp. CONT]|nr:tRNA-guanine transglycosylase [Peniophora sp. CONT]
MTSPKHATKFSFQLSSGPADSPFGPRLGQATITRPNSTINIPTPGLITATVRGVVPHLSRDTLRATSSITWLDLPFETFLESNPPVPTLQGGSNALHKFLGFKEDKHAVCMMLRDPFDTRDMPSNEAGFVSAFCIRGVRKCTPEDWRNNVLACDPDLVVALTDTPLTALPPSQKRLTKSIERSLSFLAHLLQPISSTSTSTLNVLVHLSGGLVPSARKAFAESLLEPLYGKDLDSIRPFKSLDDGVCGYTFDLAPLHKSLSPTSPLKNIPSSSSLNVRGTLVELDSNPNVPSPSTIEQLVPLLQASLTPLPTTKPRIAHSAGSPHEMLVLIRDVGIDLFDAQWAQRAADVGLALDFTFPVPPSTSTSTKRDLGHNLYSTLYTRDFSPLADSFAPGNAPSSNTRPRCNCMACTIHKPTSVLRHSKMDEKMEYTEDYFYSRAYMHHLLHTHEMSASAFLVTHNLSVLDSFLAGVRDVLAIRPEEFGEEVERFLEGYDGELMVLGRARVGWAEVELARGRGRLNREKGKQGESTLGTAIELDD